MTLDLSKPLRHKDSHEPAFIVALPSGQYVTIIDGRDDTGTRVYHATDREEAERMLENAPETRTLDCWAAVLTTPHANGYMGSLWADKSAAKETVLGGQQHECHVHITQEYEVGEGLS